MIGKRKFFQTRARLSLEMTIESIFGEKAMKHSDLNVFIPVETEKSTS